MNRAERIERAARLLAFAAHPSSELPERYIVSKHDLDELRAALDAKEATTPDKAWIAINTAAENTSLAFLKDEPDLYAKDDAKDEREGKE